jgi:DNA-binding IclR family transcriptional regulator
MSDITSKDSPLQRYISILETVAPFSEGLTAIELETALDLPKTTVNRLLHALMSSGMISADNVRNRTYRLGDRILRLMHTSPDTSWLATLARQPLQMLANKTGQSAFISKFDGTEVRSVTCVAPDAPIRTYVMPGMSMPVNAAATAKAILAFQPEDVLARVLPRRLERYTEMTKTELDVLMSEFAVIRERGYATDLAEHVAGLGSIALPVHVPGAEVAHAVGLTGPYDRIIEREFESHRQAIAETANRLGKLLQLRTPTTSG